MAKQGGERPIHMCRFCEKPLKGKGALANHERWCPKNPNIKPPEVPAEQVEVPPILQRDPQTQQVNNIEVVGDYPAVSPLPRPPEFDESEALSRQDIIDGTKKQAEDLIKIDLSRCGPALTGAMNARLLAAKMTPLSAEERQEIEKHFNIMVDRRLYLFYKYGDIVNFGLAMTIPLLARLDQIPALQKKGGTGSKAADALHAGQNAAAHMDDSQRAMLEYEKAKQEGGK